MINRDDPAFPGQWDHGGGQIQSWTGMTLRVWLAGQALPGLIMSQVDSAASIQEQGENADLYASAALRIADSLLARLENS